MQNDFCTCIYSPGLKNHLIDSVNLYCFDLLCKKGLTIVNKALESAEGLWKRRCFYFCFRDCVRTHSMLVVWIQNLTSIRSFFFASSAPGLSSWCWFCLLFYHPSPFSVPLPILPTAQKWDEMNYPEPGTDFQMQRNTASQVISKEITRTLQVGSVQLNNLMSTVQLTF